MVELEKCKKARIYRYSFLHIFVHCRIGSLEIKAGRVYLINTVHCRIGSLEMVNLSGVITDGVHCRIGSLEMFGVLQRG